MSEGFLEVRDASDTELRIPVGVRNIVSLVPSITESLIGIGAGSRLVGRTRYCIHPKADVANVERVGGTKDPNLEKILSLKPAIVLANREENRAEDIQALRDAGILVWVCEPKGVEDALSMVAFLGNITDLVEEAAAIVLRGEQVMAQMAAQHKAQRERDLLRIKPRGIPRATAFIWRDPWMAAGGDTYISDVLNILGIRNAFDEEERYPQIELIDPRLQSSRIIFLPSEPYEFGEEDEQFLRQHCPQVERFVRCVGEDLMWFGTRTPDALMRLHRQLSLPGA